MDLIHGRVGGIEKYMMSLAYELPRIRKSDLFYFYIPSDTDSLFKDTASNVVKILISRKELDMSKTLSGFIKKDSIDMWFCPLHRLDPADVSTRSIVFISDLQHKHFPYFFSESELAWRDKYLLGSANQATSVIVPSQFTKNDILRYADRCPDEVFVVAEDAALVFRGMNGVSSSSDLKKFGLKGGNYFFYPANTWPHKNHARLIEALMPLFDKYDVNLVLTGYEHNAHEEIRSLIKSKKLEARIKFLGFVEDEELPGLYRQAKALVFPSLFEGFGIPIVEAMRSKCPVICSNSSSIPEVAGEAVVYFDPLSVKDIREKIEYFLINERDLRGKLIKLGLKQQEKFSTKRMVEETSRVIDQSLLMVKNKKKVKEKKIKWPKITVVTPSYNQGQFIERTIKSVLDQKYPKLEYIVMDGGSTDETIKILKKYDKEIQWTSKKDKGQANAINLGLKMASGEIMAYLNSDDTYEPGALFKVARYFVEHPEAMLVYGRGCHIDKNDKFIEFYPSAPTDHCGLKATCAICQPTVFWRRELYKKVGLFDEGCNYGMDYDYWIRVAASYRLHFMDEFLANTRLYGETKTLGQTAAVMRELVEINKRHYGKCDEAWIFSLLHAKMSHLDRRTVAGNTLFILGLIGGSMFGFAKFNHQLPSKNAWRLYGIWIKEMLVFIKNKLKEKL